MCPKGAGSHSDTSPAAGSCSFTCRLQSRGCEGTPKAVGGGAQVSLSAELHLHGIYMEKLPTLLPCGEGAPSFFLVGEETTHPQGQTSSAEPRQLSCSDLHQPNTQLMASAPCRGPRLKRRSWMYVSSETISWFQRGRGALSSLSCLGFHPVVLPLLSPVSPLEVPIPRWPLSGSTAQVLLPERCSPRLFPIKLLLLHLLPPWLNHLKAELSLQPA